MPAARAQGPGKVAWSRQRAFSEAPDFALTPVFPHLYDAHYWEFDSLPLTGGEGLS